MSTETIAVAGLVLTVVALAITVFLTGFKFSHLLGSIENELTSNTATLKDMATKRDLDNQTAALKAELVGQTEVVKAELSGLEKRTLDRLDSIKDDLKEINEALQARRNAA